MVFLLFRLPGEAKIKSLISCKSISYMVFLLFRLPGEAMQIDRVMDAFAAHYCAQNPYLFQGMDITFAVQYSLRSML
jgi:hypothetical protein